MTERSSPTPGPADAAHRPRRAPRWTTWLLAAVLCLAGLVLVILLGLQHPRNATAVANAVLARLHVVPRSVLTAREVRGTWITSLELHSVRLARGDTLLASVDTLRARYRILSLLTGRLHVRELDLAGVDVRADIVDTARSQTSTTSPGPPITLADVLHGRFYSGPALRVDRLAVRRARYGGRLGATDSVLVSNAGLQVSGLRLGKGTFSFVLDSLEVQGPPGASGKPGLSFGLAARMERGRFEARTVRFTSDSSTIDGNVIVGVDDRDSLSEARLVLHGRPWSLHDLERLLPGLDLQGTVTADIDVHGTRPDRMTGTISANTDLARWGPLELGAVRLNALLADGRSDTKLSAVCGRARTEVSGWIRPFDVMPTYDFEARADRLPDRIPGAEWWTELARRASSTVSVRLQGTGFAKPVMSVHGRAEGDIGVIDLDGGLDLTRGAGWTVRRLAFQRLDLARLVGDSAASAVSGTLTASGRSDSVSRTMIAVLRLEPSTYGDWTVTSGGARARIDGANVGGSLRLETDAGTVQVDSLSGRWDSVGVMRLLGGRFQGLDLAAITRQPGLASRLDGRVNAEVRGLGSLGGPTGGTAAMRDGRVSGTLHVALEPSRFGEQEIGKGSLALALTRGNVGVQGGIESTGGSIDLAARGRPFDSRPAFDLDRARLSNVDLAAWTGTPSLSSRLSGTMTGHARSSGPGSSGTWEGTLQLDPSRFGRATIKGGNVRASGSSSGASMVATLHSDHDTLSARGDVTVRDRVPEGHADVTVPMHMLAAIAGRDTLAANGGLTTRVDFAGTSPESANVEGTVSGAGSIGKARLDSLFARIHLQHGTLVIDTLLARSNVGVTKGAGRIALFDTTATAASDLHVTMRVDDAKPLRELFAADTMALDTSTVDLRISNVAGQRRFEARGSLRSLAFNGIRLTSADGTAGGELDPSWRPTRVQVESSLRRLRGVGIPVNEAEARIDFDHGATAFDVKALQDERHRLHLVGRASPDSLGQHVAIDRLDLQADSTAWSLTNPTRIDYGHDRFEVRDFALRSPTGRIQAGGVIDRRGNQDFRLDMNNVGLDVVSVLLGRENVAGRLNGSLALEGPAAAPRGRGDFQLDLTSDHQPAGGVRSRLAWNGAKLDFAGAFASPAGDSLAWNGSLPLAMSLAVSDSSTRVRVLEGDVDVRLAAQHFPLQALSPLLDPRAVGTLAGTLDLDARLRGSSHAVMGNGRMDVNGGVVPLPGIGATYRDVELHGEFVDNRLAVRRAHMASEKGTIDATGEIRFIGVTRVEPNLHVTSNRFTFVNTTDLRAIASGSVDVTGTVTSPVVKGKATIENSSLTLKPTEMATEESATTVKLTDADWRMLEENFGDVKPEGPDLALQLYDASDLDLDITLQRNNWVRQRVSPKLSLAITGNVRLEKAPHGEPLLYGRIEPIPGRGYVEQFARSFDITGGDVLLNGAMNDHRVDINAQYKPPSSSESDESETTIQLEVQGTAEKLSLTLSSEPPMSEVEIINFIATGHSAADKSAPSSSESSASLAKDIGLSQVTGFAEEAAQEAIGLDVLQVRFDALQGATLVAGRYVDPQLYVGFRQPLQYQQSSSPSSGETQRTSFEVEYAIHQWLVLNLQGETSKLRSFIRARHAY